MLRATTVRQQWCEKAVSKIWFVKHTGLLLAFWSGKAQTLFFQLIASTLRLLVTLPQYCTGGANRQGGTAKSFCCMRYREFGRLAGSWQRYCCSRAMIPALPSLGLGSWWQPANRKVRFLIAVLPGIMCCYFCVILRKHNLLHFCSLERKMCFQNISQQLNYIDNISAKSWKEMEEWCSQDSPGELLLGKADS